MRSKKAAAVVSVLLYSQGLLGFAAVVALLMKQPEPAQPGKGTVSASTVSVAKLARVAG
ncbi:hypothetical protein SAMN04488498_10375 [Mesorhizobium albiziae]|uniref:Uncharacterized protein n=1 Tax=Neomesorhizobium albiziae TaxID=335020 RepID=A0A1I3X9R2_9HYPH|nr:hypothetical protein [Mesorhizobium albiziae]SFK16250.1 hypothetical protein SAMN04488498_10375 [Mesorhizobium albiziae]